MAPVHKQFGPALRAKRREMGFTLRGFAEKAGVSPAYLSLVETGRTSHQPTVERIKTMASLLGADTDEWIHLAGRVSDELEAINRNNPQVMPALLRIARSIPPEELVRLAAKADRRYRMRGKG